MDHIQNFIDGKSVAPVSGEYLDVFEPATGQVYAKAPASGSEDVDRAVGAAQAAFPAWSNTRAEQRASILYALADRIEANLDDLARAECVDTGKPLSLAKSVDIPRAVSNLRFFAGALSHFSSESHGMQGLGLNYTLRQPLGVVATISPWNLPLYLFTWKIAPALAAGNTVVAKPSEVTPMTAYLFCQLAESAGVPEGVLNVVHGRGAEAGQALVEHPDVKAVSFTGSTATGRRIAAAVANDFKKLSLEMGGKNPTLIFNDADLDKHLDTMVRSAFSNQGQICLCGSRILVHNAIYKEFRDRFTERVNALTVGDPMDDGTDQGALVSEQHYGKVLSYLQLARDEGGDFLCGGDPVKLDGRCAQGWFVQPTLIEGLDAHSRTNQEEIFGPVASLIPFADEAEALQIANATPYGLASSIWTKDLNRAHRVAEHIESGIVWVNCWMLRDLRTPFGGMKQSGLGREGGLEALRFFTETKNVCLNFQ